MGITVLKNNVPWGPFTRAQIDEGLKRGDFTLQYLAHAPGIKEWLPLGEVLHFLEVGATLPPVPETSALPPVPGSRPPILPPALKGTWVEVPLPEPVAERSETTLPKASFFARGIAFLIDCTVLFVPILSFFLLDALWIEMSGWWNKTDAESMRQEWALFDRNFYRLLLLVALGLGWLYGAGLECSRWQATIGKRWVGIKVTDKYGERLGFLQSSGRLAAKYLSALPFFLGFIMALFSSRGLALHDRLAGTRVVRR